MRRWYECEPLMAQCKHCPNGDFCLKHGCVARNDEVRAKYDRWKASANPCSTEGVDYTEAAGCRRGFQNWSER